MSIINIYIWQYSLIPLACAECNNYLPFSGASSIPLCYVLFLATLLCQLLFHYPSLHLAIYFLVYLSILLFPNSYIILFWEFYFLPFSVHAQTTVRVKKISRPKNNVLYLEFCLSNARKNYSGTHITEGNEYFVVVNECCYNQG